MSIFYFVSITLDLKYKKNSIDCFFQQCLENNIRLYTDPFDNLNKLDSISATMRILSMKLKSEEHSVRAKFQDTDFFIRIYQEKNSLLSFSIGDFGIKWRKEFINDHYDIDFARYIRLLLRVCRNFTILELKTSAV